MEAFINPILFYLCLIVGGFGIALALPRRVVSPQIIGGMIAAAGFGVIFLLLGLRTYEGDPSNLPSPYFYLFSFIAIAASLRVISHPRPVYAALYFIMTILSSSVLYLLLEAEFMAFALIIIYAGAILITYLFVIMLASQAPSETEVGSLSEYDAYSREPMVATVLGFVLLAVLSGLIATGLAGNDSQPALKPASVVRTDLTPELPKKVLRELDSRGFFGEFVHEGGSGVPFVRPELDAMPVDGTVITLTVDDASAASALLADPYETRVTELLVDETAAATAGGTMQFNLPRGALPSNIDGVGYTLVAGHPMALELAGVILLMAMLGAVVLARKQIELTEDEKAARARTLEADLSGGGS